MGLREDLLPDLDDIRGIPGELGLRRHEVYVERTVYTGVRTGLASSGAPSQGTTTTTKLLVGGQNPKVREIQRKDIIGGSDAKDILYEIGPLSPEFFTDRVGGTAPAVLDPPLAGQRAEVHYVIKGPGITDPNGVRCKLVEEEMVRAFRYTIRVRRVGRAGG